MRKILIALILWACSTPLFGALSPLNQSLAELRALIESPSLPYHLPQADPVISIVHFDGGYKIVTPALEMVVDIEYLPVTQPGPRQFKLNFNSPTPVN